MLKSKWMWAVFFVMGYALGLGVADLVRGDEPVRVSRRSLNEIWQQCNEYNNILASKDYVYAGCPWRGPITVQNYEFD